MIKSANMDPWLEHYATTFFRRGLDLAHDLKAPLNVATLQLALLRMHLGKQSSEGIDPKTAALITRVESELARAAAIADAFFVASVPSPTRTEPQPIDIGCLLAAEASRFGLGYTSSGQAIVSARSETVIALGASFFAGVTRSLFDVKIDEVDSESDFVLEISGELPEDRDDPMSLLRFDCVDAEGNAELGIATAALIAQVLGGTMEVTFDGLRLTSRLRIPANRS